MPRGSTLLPALWLAAASASAADGDFNLSSGVNLTADEVFGARPAGMAVDFAAFQRDADAAANSPAAMNDVDDFTFSTAHVEKFGRAQFDDFAIVLPFEANATMGLALSRFGVSEIELRPEGTDPLSARPQGLFTAADYVVSGAFARRWGGLDLGVGLDLLYRHLDQDGLGLRADAMAQYTWDGRSRLSLLLKGLVPSTARWSSGYVEYEAPDLYIGGAKRIPVPYFYGTLEAAFQSEGLLGKRAKSQRYLQSGSLLEDPMELAAATRLGLEFLFDFGMSARVGLTELSPHALPSTATFGIGYSWRRILGIDYAFTPHPGLLSTHRVSLQLTPAFPKLDGRGYRPRRAPVPTGPAPAEAIPAEEGEIEEHESPPPSGQAPAQGEIAPHKDEGPAPEEPEEEGEIFENGN